MGHFDTQSELVLPVPKNGLILPRSGDIMPLFTASTELRCSAEVLRDYLGRTSKLPTISDPDLQLTIISAPETVTADSVIEFRISAYGLKQTMKHRYNRR